MNRKTPIFVLLFASVVVLAFLFVLMHHSKKPQPAKTAKVAAVVKPKPNLFVVGIQPALAAGTLLQPGMIGKIVVKTPTIPSDEIKYSEKALHGFYGAMLKKNTAPATPLTDAMVIKPGDSGFLAAVLKPGDQAMTIPVDAVTDAAGLIWPGDRVDVLLIQSMPAAQIQTGHNIAAETVLHDVKIIATGNSILPPTGPKSNGSSQVRTVTLEVSPIQAKRLAVAERLGPLSLTVLSAKQGKKLAETKFQSEAKNDPDRNLVWAYQASPALTDSDSNRVTIFTNNNQQGYTVP